ncbi:MAG: hypothetical protein QOH25_4061 [Acidobacteriota bacterium]|jgi:multisubunit Na+/H+ antiporter MnhC subunit|nr:hypothetical protein [Acidobacteriota bacterium]
MRFINLITGLAVIGIGVYALYLTVAEHRKVSRPNLTRNGLINVQSSNFSLMFFNKTHALCVNSERLNAIYEMTSTIVRAVVGLVLLIKGLLLQLNPPGNVVSDIEKVVRLD